jgi:hypothetical protein
MAPELNARNHIGFLGWYQEIRLSVYRVGRDKRASTDVRVGPLKPVHPGARLNVKVLRHNIPINPLPPPSVVLLMRNDTGIVVIDLV